MTEIAFGALRVESDGTGYLEFEVDNDQFYAGQTVTREEALRLAYWILSEVTEPADGGWLRG